MKLQNNIFVSQNISESNNLRKGKNSNEKFLKYPVYKTSFGLNNPKAALYRAENLKEQYAQLKLNYLLPKDVWNNKKIFKTLDKIGAYWDKLKSLNKISTKNLNKVLDLTLPERVSKKIVFKDLKELEQHLLNKGYTKEQAKAYSKASAGMTSSDKEGNTIIFLNLSKLENKFNKVESKGICLHEIKHALTKNCTNIETSDKYNSFEKLISLYSKDKEAFTAFKNELKYYNKIFLDVYFNYRATAKGCYQTEISTDKFLSNLKNIRTGKIGFKSLEEFHKDIENEFNFVRNKYKLSATENLPQDAFDNKVFWNKLKHDFKDEKEAYKTDITFREYFDDKTKPTSEEFRSMLHGELEKFCDKKSKSINK